MSFYSIFISLFLILNISPKDSVEVKKIANLSDTLESHEIFEPTDAALGDRGNLFIFDNGKKKIHVFDEKFDHRFSFGSQGPGPGEFDRRVTEILTTNRGNIVALEKWERMIHYFKKNGKYMDSFFVQKEPSNMGVPQADRGFGVPLDIAVDQKGYVYLTDRVWYYSKDRVSLFDSTGKFIYSQIPQDNFITYRRLSREYNDTKKKQIKTGEMMNNNQLRISVTNSGELIAGERDKYVIKKYTGEFVLRWKKEMDFDPVKPPHAPLTTHHGNEAYDASMGEGAVADIDVNDNENIFVSVGSFDGTIEREKLNQLSHWIDVFDQSGNHLARLLEDELPPLPRRQGYRIAVHDSRLLVLGDTELWIYEIVRDQ